MNDFKGLHSGPRRSKSLLKIHFVYMIVAMGSEITIQVPDSKDLGPAMRALTDMQRGFVVAYFTTGDRTKAAYAAGYSQGSGGPGGQTSRTSAYQVWHNPKVQEGIKEFAAQNIIGSVVPKAMKALEEIIDDAGHKDRAKAVGMVLDRTGLHAKTETIHSKPQESREDRIMRLVMLAKRLGMDPRKLLGGAMDFVDADFTVIDKAEPKVVIDVVNLNMEPHEPEPIPMEGDALDGLEDIL